jgi:hypothetical protein
MPCYRKGRASKDKGKGARNGERRFADSVKTMVSGEAVFALSMSVRASLIRGNLLRRLSATVAGIGKKYFLFSNHKVRSTAAKPTTTPCQRPANKNVANT